MDERVSVVFSACRARAATTGAKECAHNITTPHTTDNKKAGQGLEIGLGYEGAESSGLAALEQLQ